VNTCTHEYGLMGEDDRFCGAPADPKSESVAGQLLCAYHLEQFIGSELV
jgi:hypothetical protein